ncbi:MAG TPA: hypothetical protein VKZ63_13445, partial [Kofleriaceae bacterium]|nr:hypothetical protein [Kofleriaceae bacterium]
MDRRLLLAAALGAALAPRPARADGPVPHTTSVHLQPGGQRILLGSDSGLLISDDGGASFHWVCGEAYGVSNLYQPKHAVTASGEMYATTPDGLRLSRDGGCTWELLGEPVGQGTTVVTVGPDGRVWAASTAQHRPNDVYRSVDGAAFESTGLSAEGVWWLSVLTTSDPGRVYASGTRLPVGETPGEALLRRSDDGGDTWQELPVDPFAFGGSTPYLFLLGVAPADPDLLFARAAGVAQGGDAVYRSTDGGQSWAHVLDMGGPVDGFVVREDGATVVVGSRYPCRGEAGSGQGCVRISQDVGQSYRPAELQ